MKNVTIVILFMFPTDLKSNYPEAIKFLTNALLQGRLANSYVFIGKDSDGILKITKTLAKILNCDSKGLPWQTPSVPRQVFTIPCEQCTNCQWIERNEHPQAFITVRPDPESKKEQIKIDNIRELLNILNTTSEYFRVIYFQTSSLQSLPPDSCNLLLKTVEETPERTVFIFANQSRNDILGTILSRSQTVYLSKKSSSIFELIKTKTIDLPDDNLTECFLKGLPESLEKSKKTHELLEKNDINLKDYLTNLCIKNYDLLKYKDQKQYCFLHKNITYAYLKLKSFMQPKIVIEDLFLSFTK